MLLHRWKVLWLRQRVFTSTAVWVEWEPLPEAGAAAVGAWDVSLAGRAGTRSEGLITTGMGGGGDGTVFVVGACTPNSIISPPRTLSFLTIVHSVHTRPCVAQLHALPSCDFKADI